FCCRRSRSHLALHSFPTRRSSDLMRPRSGFMSSTTPWKLTNGPSTTRTLSPRWNTDLGFGFSAPASMLRMISSTWSVGSDTGLRSEEHTSELQSPDHLVCRLLLEK